MTKELQKIVEDGQHAEAVLENPLFKRLAEEMRKDCFDKFKGGDETAALEARREIRVFEDFLTKFAVAHKRGMDAANKQRDLAQRQSDGLPIDINNVQGIA